MSETHRRVQKALEVTNAERWEVYKICKERGHTPSGRVLTSYPPWQVCKFCDTHYRVEQVVKESNVPTPPDRP